MNSESHEFASLLAQRELWLLVSAGFVDPYHKQRFAILRDPAFREKTVEAARLLAQEHPAIELGLAEVDLKTISPRDLFDAFDADHKSLETTYRRLFGLTAISQPCPPCEGEYEPNTEVAYRSQRLADVAGFYRAFGLQISARAGERLDHVTVQTEFLYLLLAKEAAAVVARNREGAEVSRSARRKFFQEHVGWWLPAFSRLLSRVSPAGFYRQLGALTGAMSAVERVSLGLPRFKPPSAAKRPEPQAASFECGR